jgi:hypothetical protein
MSGNETQDAADELIAAMKNPREHPRGDLLHLDGERYFRTISVKG